jgi:hypothetical protein
VAPGDDQSMLLSLLHWLLEQPESPFNRRFDALTSDHAATARCRKCQAIDGAPQQE